MIIREKMDFDVLIVGAGPAGLSAAIRLGQLNQTRDTPLSIAIIEKGAQVGAHILSGAVLEPSALNQLLPNWQQLGAPVKVPVKKDQFLLLSQKRSYALPVPPTMKNHGNYIISLGLLCQWLAEQAEALGISIFPGFAGSDILYDDAGQVIGIQTDDKGLNKEGTPGPQFQAGIELYAKQTIFAEGCRGSLTEQLIKRFGLRAQSSPQTYGLGIKELWEVDSPAYSTGTVTHTVGWPLDQNTYGGGFIYHLDQNRVALGLVIGLDYQNPYLDPFEELQRFKTHPSVRSLLNKGRCLCYGAKALNEGGWQSIPDLTFPGGLLVGCGAGFVNVGKIKGIHNAMLSGILAAESVEETEKYTDKIRHSKIHNDLYPVRNLRPGFRWGLWFGLAYAALDQYVFHGQTPWTLKHKPLDHLALRPAKYSTKLSYAKPDGKLTFSKLNQVSLSGTQHRESAPSHLILKNPDLALTVNLTKFDSPEQRYCPAGVYEIIHKSGQASLQINASNCLHCKACDIKDPSENIIWTVPEGGSGPNYIEF